MAADCFDKYRLSFEIKPSGYKATLYLVTTRYCTSDRVILRKTIIKPNFVGY